MNSVLGGWRVVEARKASVTGGRLNSGKANPPQPAAAWAPGGSKTLASWPTERVVRCRIVGIEPFQRRQLDLARPESAFPQVGKSRAFVQPEFMRA